MQIESALTDAIRPVRPASPAALADPSAAQDAAGPAFVRPDLGDPGADQGTGGAFGQVVSQIGGPLSADAVTALQQAPESQNQPQASGDETQQQAQVSAFAPPPPPQEENADPTDEEEVATEEEEQLLGDKRY